MAGKPLSTFTLIAVNRTLICRQFFLAIRMMSIEINVYDDIITRLLELTPHHLVDNAHVTLYNLHDLGADILVHIVGDGNAVLAVTAELDGGVNGLEQGLLVNTCNDEVALVDGLGSLGRSTDADGGEGVADAGEERGFLGKGAAIADDGESVHLKAVVVVEAEGLVLNDTWVELEA